MAQPDNPQWQILARAKFIGHEGVPRNEMDRLTFEHWMIGHCWKVVGDWNGSEYVHPSESPTFVHPDAMDTRRLFAAWVGRGALEQWDKARAIDEFASQYLANPSELELDSADLDDLRQIREALSGEDDNDGAVLGRLNTETTAAGLRLLVRLVDSPQIKRAIQEQALIDCAVAAVSEFAQAGPGTFARMDAALRVIERVEAAVLALQSTQQGANE
jgi:hypothetical protein